MMLRGAASSSRPLLRAAAAASRCDVGVASFSVLRRGEFSAPRGTTNREAAPPRRRWRPPPAASRTYTWTRPASPASYCPGDIRSSGRTPGPARSVGSSPNEPWDTFGCSRTYGTARSRFWPTGSSSRRGRRGRCRRFWGVGRWEAMGRRWICPTGSTGTTAHATPRPSAPSSESPTRTTATRCSPLGSTPSATPSARMPRIRPSVDGTPPPPFRSTRVECSPGCPVPLRVPPKPTLRPNDGGRRCCTSATLRSFGTR
mmetsp:Transcript_43796/g.133281  ORF Transcript_43796/g.133281 Transcript_43796/m.133281 type:complete len:258 (-) Transcript_43796:416-1189(-)